ncbi:MAG: NADH:ubiquinone oxidoreductase subunit NDUFA12 [Alphaproteobacteria bacterium]|nr:NADH:ubiquinone oxidoreductase subunit NDUFA12 [Alphaproteobacteria bacterium]
MSIGTLLYTWRHGRLVGTDETGNRYYTERTEAKGRRTRRWVVFQGEPEATKVPPEWHSWLHHTTDLPLNRPARPHAKPHEPNRTGTPEAWLPEGHDRRGGKRQRSTADYEAWTP